jgi:hypothetical protein
MNKEILLITAVLSGMSLGCEKLKAIQTGESQLDHPNFILLLTDDQSYQLSMVGTHGIKPQILMRWQKWECFLQRPMLQQHRVHHVGALSLRGCIPIRMATGAIQSPR